jgi:IMP dehydrogenase
MLSVTLQPRSSQVPVENGADGVKVGIDLVQFVPPYCSRCWFQFSAVPEVAAALKGTGVPVIADGGIWPYRETFLRPCRRC